MASYKGKGKVELDWGKGKKGMGKVDENKGAKGKGKVDKDKGAKGKVDWGEVYKYMPDWGKGKKGMAIGAAPLTREQLKELKRKRRKSQAQRKAEHRRSASNVAKPKWLEGFRTPMGFRFGPLGPREVVHRVSAATEFVKSKK